MASSFHLLHLKSRFKLITFDVTNTLLKFQSPVGVAYSNVGKLHGVECDASSIASAFKAHWTRMREKYPNFGRSCGLSARVWWNELVCNAFRDVNPSVSEKELTVICNDLFERYTTKECWKVPAGTKELLHTLKQHNVSLGVISNFDDRLDSVLISTGLKSYFQFILASYSVALEKPDPKIFDLALSKVCHLNVKPSDAIHIGDDLHLDYFAAKNAGWNALLIRSYNEMKTCSSLDVQETVSDIQGIQQYILQPV